MMLPRPNLSFTLPSIHDGTKLDCRVYHPPCLAGSVPSPWQRNAAVVAHPYAPLGGCYDDPVVAVIASTLLRVGYVVATFNFRGASSSEGRTSWSSKPERADYMSIASFLVYYVHYLHLSDRPSSPATGSSPLPTLLLAGYSYGAIVTIELPPLASFLSQFASPPIHTAFADIRLRAQHLAEQQTIMATTAPASPRKSLGMRIGGNEDSPQQAHERPRAHSPDREERIRRGVKDLLSRSKLIHRTHESNVTGLHRESEREVPCLGKLDNLIRFRSAYLAVSPPLGIVAGLATLNLPNLLSSWAKRKRGRPSSATSEGGEAGQEETEAEAKLTRDPTLAVYGDQDSFLSLKRAHEWARQLSSAEGSQFCHVEVPGAGHFWVEEGVLYELNRAVFSFASSLTTNA
ncbi:Alpha/Beta hydrolase protein [Hypoxylon sp. FL1284]|nr:Alpha/Beta hydrolase protein [Hypoxylon sp. FL1284]